MCFLLLGRCEGRPSFERETPGRPSFCLSHPPLLWRHLTPLPIAPRARTGGRHSPLGRSLPRASGRGPLPYIKFYCSSSACAACWKRRQALAWSETTFPPYLLRWTSSFARDDDAQQERRNGFSAIATMLSLFPSLCVSFCLAAVRGARASRGRRQAGLLFVFGFPS